jgi:redox-sensitive bicupin YhaK (pirin superfamily)
MRHYKQVHNSINNITTTFQQYNKIMISGQPQQLQQQSQPMQQQQQPLQQQQNLQNIHQHHVNMKSKIQEYSLQKSCPAELVEQSKAAFFGTTTCRMAPQSFRELDPFISIEYFGVPYPFVTPDHAHKGLEAIHYTLNGAFKCEDFLGNLGFSNAGEAHLLTAGRGTVHCETVLDKDLYSDGILVNVVLDKTHRNIEPSTHFYTHNEFPVALPGNSVNVRVIAGEYAGFIGPIQTKVPTNVLDISLEKDSSVTVNIPKNYTAYCFVIAGRGRFGVNKKEAGEWDYVKIQNGDSRTFAISSTNEACRVIFVSGKPTGEKFVSNTYHVGESQQDLEMADEDFKNGVNGFEKAKGYKSQIVKHADPSTIQLI